MSRGEISFCCAQYDKSKSRATPVILFTEGRGVDRPRRRRSFPGLLQQTVELCDGRRIGPGEFIGNDNHVVDRDQSVLAVPVAGCAIGIRNYTLQPRVLGQGRAVNRRVEFAGNQHGRNVPIGACPDNARWVASFRHMTVLEGHPLHAAEIDAVIILQNTSDPHAGGLTIRTDAMRRPGSSFGVSL